MSTAKGKADSKAAHRALRQQKQRRRQWITTVRMVRYGINNFSRNAWLTIAATAVMTITLLIIFITMAARNILNDSLTTINDQVDISIYLNQTTPDEKVTEIKREIEALSTVKSVRYISPDEARQEAAAEQKDDPTALEALNTGTNVFPKTFRVVLHDIENVSEIQNYVQNDETIVAHLQKRTGSIEEGKSSEIVRTIGRWMGFAANSGITVATVFVVLSMLIVFNTIRMAIFSRKEEIQMMKLIGADRKFIRGPFVVEAVVYGFIAAILATGLGTLLLMTGGPGLESFGIAVQPTLNVMYTYGVFVLLAMIACGAVIGVLSSLLAVRKYLKV